ncbi:PIN domain-containing protein [Dactylosporangium salmoneum]|uniref:PIN domain-containing protein n=1 Tax=Dactylosporangium salmoneum TaxID=53361 RepID=UPI0031DC2B82
MLDLLYGQGTIISNHHGNPGGYLDWAMETARLLRNQIQRSDIDRLVLTPQLSQLRNMLDVHPRVVNPVLDMEITERSELFDLARRTLKAEIDRWDSRPGLLVVVDTSVFMSHPNKIRDIDYAAELGRDFDDIRLVLPLVVVDELDRLKESGANDRRWRAGHTLGVLDELLRNRRAVARLRSADNFRAVAEAGGMPRGEVTVEVFFDQPGHVRMAEADDEIVDRACAIQALAGRRVRLLTMDTSMSMRARMADLEVHKIARDIGPEPQPPVLKAEKDARRGNARRDNGSAAAATAGEHA